jgi:hypothetical protein
MKTGIELITDERTRQVNAEGWTQEHDSQHWRGGLVLAAISYSMQYYGTMDILSEQRAYWRNQAVVLWPWWKKWWKPANRHSQPSIRDLVKAGALIAAEIDRWQADNNRDGK